MHPGRPAWYDGGIRGRRPAGTFITAYSLGCHWTATVRHGRSVLLQGRSARRGRRGMPRRGQGMQRHPWPGAGGSGRDAIPPGGVQGWNPCKNPIRKYYYAGAQRVAMRENETLYFLLADHLGSTSITANSSGTKVAELRYKAWGEERYTWGTTPTTFRYTGQREQADIGLYYYGARWYDASLARFTQPDSIVPSPGEPQSLNRFSYVKNDPLGYKDPSGHREERSVQGEEVTKKGEPEPPDGGYSRRNALIDAGGIVLAWLAEIGPEEMRMGPSYATTQALMHDYGVEQARAAYEAAGCPSTEPKYRYPYDIQAGGGVAGWVAFAAEWVQFVPCLFGLGSRTPEGKSNPLGAVLGSYTTEVYPWPNGTVEFKVTNKTGRESFLRVPGVGPLLSDVVRSETKPFLTYRNGWGGTIKETFFWFEVSPCQ